jgi:hypothetical protein
MRFRLSLLLAALASASAPAAFGHLTYLGHDYGTFIGGSAQAKTLSGLNVEGNSGWADGTDADFALTHYQTYFKFVLSTAATITLSVQADDPAFLLPAFSIFAGLGHTADPDYDEDNPYTTNYLATLPGPPKEGAFRSLNTWQMYNDGGKRSIFTYMAHAADGTAANYGPAAGINGDGVADGFVSGTFSLLAGEYTVVVGGANYNTQNDFNYYYFSTTLAVVVPEPSSALLVFSGLSLLGMTRRRPKSAARPAAFSSPALR